MDIINSSLFYPQNRAAAIQLDLQQFTERVQESHANGGDWTSLKVSEKTALKIWEILVLKVIHFAIKIFNSKYADIDQLFSANEELQNLKKLQHKTSKLQIQNHKDYKSPYILSAEKIEMSASKACFQSLKSAVLRDHFSQIQKAQSSQNFEVAAEKYHTLSDKLRKILINIAEMNATGRKPYGKNVEQMLAHLSQICDEHGDNVYTQLEHMLEKKRKLCWDLSVLKLTEQRLHQGASASDVEADIQSLLEQHRKLILQGGTPSSLSQEELLKRILTLSATIEESSIKAIDETFHDLLKKVHRHMSIYQVSAERLTDEIPKEILSKPVSVTMVGVEYAGLIKEGGLAEVLEGLSKAMKKQHPDNKVRVIFPKISTLPTKIQEKIQQQPSQSYRDKGGESFSVTQVDFDGIEFHFIDHPSFQLQGKEQSIYDEEQKERFAAFSGLAADLIKQLSPTDVIHLHDWHVAGVGLRLKSDDPQAWRDKKIPPIVFTYHNNNRMAQGRFGQGVYNYNPVIQGLIQAGIATKEMNIFVETVKSADAVTTVSETFGIESQQHEKGEGIAFAIREAAESGKLTGVINGSNPARWNPETDVTLKEWKDVETGKPIDLTFGPTSSNISAQKKASREQLQKWVDRYMPGVNIDLSKPLVTFIGRLDAYQKGLDKLDEAIEATLKNGGQFIVMGAKPKDEDPEAKKILDQLEAKYPKGVLFIRDFKLKNDRYYYQQGDKTQPGMGSLARAATDFIFIPSRYEPCGLVQFEGWLYGSLAIGSNTGGLADTIVPPKQWNKPFNGYLFEREGKGDESLSHIMAEALNTWSNMGEDKKVEVMKRVMLDARKFSWTTSPTGYSPVEKYRFVYENAKQRTAMRQQPTDAKHFSLKAYMSLIRDSSLLPKGLPLTEAELLEENYHRRYYNSNLDSEKLDVFYRSIPKFKQSQVPSPYGKNVDFQKYERYGAHLEGTKTRFALSAPNAVRVSVKVMTEHGTTLHPMSKKRDGSWEITLDVGVGTKYQYLVNGQAKIDPYGLQHTPIDSSCKTPYSVVRERNGYSWQDQEWQQERTKKTGHAQPMSIYEMHPTTWKKKDGRPLNYRELAVELVKHCQKTGYTHVELMGILEHSFEDSWGYRVSGFYAPNSRMGSPDDFKYMVDYLHQNKIGVILDWIPAHFSKDSFGLGKFDSSNQYEVSGFSIIDILRYIFFNWGTKFFTFDKKPVREFLISSAAFWLKEMHIDGLRVDAVKAIIVGGNQANRLFLKDLNAVVHQQFPGTFTIAEDYSGATEMTQTVAMGGLGFDLKWHIGWKDSFLSYFSKPPSQRSDSYHQLVQAVESDNFNRQVMAISHDEIKDTLTGWIETTPGLSDTEKYANLRSMIGFMMTLPGKKLMFMGSEIGSSQDWTKLLHTDAKKGLMETEKMQEKSAQETMAAVQAFNKLYKENKALWEKDVNAYDLDWIVKNDPAKSLLAYRRYSSEGQSFACLHNFNPKESKEHFIPFTKEFSQDCEKGLCPLVEVMNTDATQFGGSGRINEKIKIARDWRGTPIGYHVAVPPLSTIIIKERDSSMFAPITLHSREYKEVQKEAQKNARMQTQPHWIMKIGQAASKALQYLVDAIKSVTRYFGAKNWSVPGAIIRLPYLAIKKATGNMTRTFGQELFGTGYNRSVQKVLNREEIIPYFKYATAAEYAHKSKDVWVAPLNYTVLGGHSFTHDQLQGLPPGLEARKNCFYNPTSLLKAAVLQKGNEVIVSFGALGSSETEGFRMGGLSNNINASGVANLVGIKPSIYKEAEAFVIWLKNQPEFKGKEISLCGQCFGGSLASYCGLKQELKAVALNAFPLGQALQQDITQEKLDNADAYVTNISVKGDVYSKPVFNVIDTIVSALGIKTPGTFGKRFEIPSAYKKGSDIHIFFMGSVMSLMGFNKRIITADLPREFLQSLP